MRWISLVALALALVLVLLLSVGAPALGRAAALPGAAAPTQDTAYAERAAILGGNAARLLALD